MSPSPWEAVPPRPLLFVFRREDPREPEIVSNARFEVVRRERFGSIVFEALQFEQTRGRFRVRVGRGPELHYRISRRWEAPPFQPRDGVATFVEDRGFCASLVGWDMTLYSEAAAFEVEWDGGHVVVPPWFLEVDVKGDPEPMRVLVGDHGCRGNMVDEVPSPERFRVFELLPNGERRLHGVFTPERAAEAPPPSAPQTPTVQPKRFAQKTRHATVRPPDAVPLVVCGAFVLLALGLGLRPHRRG
ncbi:MAG: hypothetical protein R3B99_14975 [Polyangiales bacterium]